MTDDTWHLVKNTNKVTGFIGGKSNKPAPMSQHEVDKIQQQMQDGVENQGQKCCTKLVRLCGLKMVRLLTLMVMLKKLIMKIKSTRCSNDFWSFYSG